MVSMGAPVTEAKAATHTCCPQYHQAVELVGKRWTGAILIVLIEQGPLRFSRSSRPCPTCRTGSSPSG